MTAAPTLHLAPALERIKARDFAGALTAAEAALAAHADDPALLGIAALSALQLGDAGRAVPLLERQLALSPTDRAVRFNLAAALAGLGRREEALDCATDYEGHARLARLAAQLFQEAGNPAQAALAYRHALEAVPDDWESWNNLGNCLVAEGRSAEAVAAFEAAINRAPQGVPPEVFFNLAQALGAPEDRIRRLNAASEAHRRFPGNHAVLIELGLARASAGDMEGAESALREALALEDGFGEAHLELGLLYENTNRIDALDALVETSARFDSAPEFAFLQAWSLRRHDRFAEAAEVAERIPDTIDPIRSAQLRAEIADRLGHFDEAFAHYSAMNAAALGARPAPPGPTFREAVEAQTVSMARLNPEAGPTRSPTASQPAFIVGSPRSGTTLLDTLLGGLPEVQVLEELPVLARVEAEFPKIAECTDVRQLEAARNRYFAIAEEHEGPAEGRLIVDKMPLHITHMPTIHRLFPRAPIVLVERHPCDVVLSCFMANFTLNHAMRSYADLGEAARTYAAVFENWSRARELFPLWVHTVRYERMVADLEAEMRPLLSFLGLPWRDAVLDNQTSARRRGQVRTASYSQIGQPLYARAAGRWTNYRAHLEPEMPVLRPWIEQMGYPL